MLRFVWGNFEKLCGGIVLTLSFVGLSLQLFDGQLKSRPIFRRETKEFDPKISVSAPANDYLLDIQRRLFVHHFYSQCQRCTGLDQGGTKNTTAMAGEITQDTDS